MKAEMMIGNGIEVLFRDDDGRLIDSIRCDADQAADLCRRINSHGAMKAALERFAKNAICDCAEGGEGFVCVACDAKAALAVAGK